MSYDEFRAQLVDEVSRLTRERDEARKERKELGGLLQEIAQIMWREDYAKYPADTLPQCIRALSADHAALPAEIDALRAENARLKAALEDITGFRRTGEDV